VLGRAYDITTADSGAEGLVQIGLQTFAVVIADMKMPAMNGATFLRYVRELAPDTVRVLLTGQTDVAAAVAAINEGEIFRFLTKPCPPAELRETIQAGLREHRRRCQTRVLEAQLAQAREARVHFTANISHELRTPLNVILGYVELLTEDLADELSPQQGEWLQRIGDTGQRLRALIDDLLESRILNDDPDLDMPDVLGMAALLEGLRDIVDSFIAPPGVQVIWHATPPDGRTCRLPLPRVASVLRQLVSNALKFTAAGEVRVEVLTDEDSVSLIVTDSGLGIPPAIVGQIFEPFWQGDGSFTRRHEGLGLGLHLVRQIVDRLGGAVTVDSREGEGSCFRVWLPRARGADASPPTPR
jgi:signal transduction histidine kinase